MLFWFSAHLLMLKYILVNRAEGVTFIFGESAWALFFVKGMVHQKNENLINFINLMSLISHPHIVPNL